MASQAGAPPRYGVQIPRSFWKVIAFVHDVEAVLSRFEEIRFV